MSITLLSAESKILKNELENAVSENKSDKKKLIKDESMDVYNTAFNTLSNIYKYITVISGKEIELLKKLNELDSYIITSVKKSPNDNNIENIIKSINSIKQYVLENYRLANLETIDEIIRFVNTYEQKN